MKKYIYIFIGILIVALLGTSFYLYKRQQSLLKDLGRLRTIEMSYAQENDSLKNKSVQAEYTIAELKESKDSVIQKLNAVRKELKIKDKKIENLSYIASTASRTDTVKFIDTLFVKDIKIDTTIKDEWYKVQLGLEYPSSIVVSPEFKSEKYIVASSKKVPIRPAKTKFGNLFRKKKKIVEVEVVEENPYIINKQQKFIQVVK